MNAIKPDYLTGWSSAVDYSTTGTSGISWNIHATTGTKTSVDYMAEEIDRRVRQIERERETKMYGFNFNDLEKELKELGIELSTIRSSSGEAGFEIEGYFIPLVYKVNKACKKVTKTPVRPVEPKPVPKKVIFSGPATTILWKDGTKTTVKCQGDDVFDKEKGIGLCYLKKMLGNKGNYNNIFREAMKIAEVRTKKEELASSTSTAIEGDSYYSSALDSMKKNIDEINDFMKDAADALDKALGGKK